MGMDGNCNMYEGTYKVTPWSSGYEVDTPY